MKLPVPLPRAAAPPVHRQFAPAQIARRLRLRTPTVTHHLNTLRLAGLVQLTIGMGTGEETKHYAARAEAVAVAFASLKGFLEKDKGERTGGKFYHGQIAKDGSPGLRAATSILTRSLAAHCAYFGTTFMDACQGGKSTAEAYVITGHQVVRVCFALLRDNVPFNPPTIEDYETFEAAWRARQPAFRHWLRQRQPPPKRQIPKAGQRKKKRRR